MNVQRYDPNPKIGLTKEQVYERAKQGLINKVDDESSLTTKKIITSNIFTYFNLIFFVLAIILALVGSFNNLTFLIVVVVNAVIGIVQELRSKKTLDKLKLVNTPEIVTIRDGKKRKVKSEFLVLDDIAIFNAGDQICADAIVTNGELTVNESLVTGESDEIKKLPGDQLLSGSFVISGIAKARIDRVGNDSFAAKISKDAKQINRKQKSGMMKSLTTLIQVIGVIIIPFGIMMFWNQHNVLDLDMKLSVENTAASIIGMIPEGLYLLTSIALAASTIRLAKNKTLVHDMKCIETLARVDVLCVDKTGTITEPNMKVQEIVPVDGTLDEDIHSEVCDYALSMNPDNETMKALQGYFEGEEARKRPVRIKGFSSTTKYSAVDFGAGRAYVLGAPDMILPDNTEELRSLIYKYSEQGARVLLFAEIEFQKNGPDDIFADGTLGNMVIPRALVLLSNAIRENAKETFEYFEGQGVEVKVISGDNPVTAAKAATDAGIKNASKYIDTSTLSTLDDVRDAATKYTVFGRVTPEQKRALVQALKKAGHTVAMTGDGVNDVLALKDADCGIAMASGSDAAANVSDLVLLNSDFSNMPNIVAEGRRVINNIQRSATLFLVKNIFSFVLSLISLISVSLYPLRPSQISLVSGLMIGVPSFFLALEPNHDIVKGKFLRNVFFRALPTALTAVILVEWSLLFTNTFDIAPDLASTLGFFIYAGAEYLMLYHVCKPMNKWHGFLFGAMGFAFLFAVIFLPEWFQIVRLDFACYLIFAALFLLIFPINNVMRALFNKGEELWGKIKAKVSKKKQKA